MRLIIHAGLHKTGSTYLQHILNDNHEALRERGVHYEKQPGYPAHHFAAWDMLRGDMAPLERMIAAARDAGCHTVILSSEDLEGAIFERNVSSAIEAAARAWGAEEIEWHLCLRDPGDYFSSLYAQLQHHVYADPVAMLCEVLRDGTLMILDPLRGQPGTPFWCFCFDPETYVGGFAAQTRSPVLVHDFKDREPFPGWRMLERVGVLDAIRHLPGEEGRNSRLPEAAVRDGYRDQILRLVESDDQRERLSPLIDAHLRHDGESIAAFADVVRARFAASTAATLARFACPAGEAAQARRACA